MKQHDHWTGGLTHDLVDQSECMLRALPESDEGDIGSLPGGDGPDVLYIDLASDHLVTERTHYRSDQRQPILALVGDQHSEMLAVVTFSHRFHRQSIKNCCGWPQAKSVGLPGIDAPGDGWRPASRCQETRNVAWAPVEAPEPITALTTSV